MGSPLDGCSNPSGNIFPCSDYNYKATSASNPTPVTGGGMPPEFTYSILKVMGDESGSNCIHSPIWIAADHTGDQGYFLR